MKNSKRLLTMFLAFVMALTSVVFPAQLLAESQPFAGNGFTVNFNVHSSWNNGYSAAIEITNTGAQPIEEWVLIANRNLGLTANGVSGGRLISQTADETVIAHADWNWAIAPGNHVTINLNGTHNGVTPAPTSFQLISANTGERLLIPASEYYVSFATHHETADTFNHAIVLTNNTGRIIYGWEIDFDISGGAEIDVAHVADVAQNIAQAGSRVTLSQIAGSGIVWHPGMSLHVQILGTKSEDIPVMFTNLAVFERVVVVGETPTPSPTPTPEPTTSPTPEPSPEPTPAPSPEPSPTPTPAPVLQTIYDMQADTNWNSITSATAHPTMRGTNSSGAANRVDSPARELRFPARNGTSQGLRTYGQ